VSTASSFRETGLQNRPIQSLGLTIPGTALEPLIGQLLEEIAAVGVRRLRPTFYLSTEWGVPFETIAIAIPFYLASPELTRNHAERVGHVEGESEAEIMRYLRHEVGHVLNYAYRLYDRKDWVERFGALSQPYKEEYRPEPFSRRFVRHLPGWYAQKHPDEDWSETFAVWMTPGLDWRSEYAHWPVALAKLEYVGRLVEEIGDREPLVTSTELDEDVGRLEKTIDQLYASLDLSEHELPSGLDGSLRTIFERAEGATEPASRLIRRFERPLMNDVYLWTGHFPEHTRRLVRHLASRADELGIRYDPNKESATILRLTTLVTALAMNHVHFGRYLV
jgi:hypothetical protein